MRDKLFLAAVTAIIAIACLTAPVKYILSSAGIMESEDFGNVIEPERVYEGEDAISAFLNSVERGKAGLLDIYTNYIPFYSVINTRVNTLFIDMNRGINAYYMSLMAKQEADPAAELPTEGAKTDMVENPETEGESPFTAPEYLMKNISSYSSSYLRGIYYAIDLKFADSSESGLITLIHNDTDEGLLKRITEQSNQVNRIAGALPEEVKVGVYVCSRLQDGGRIAEYIPGARSLKPYVDEYLSLLDSRIVYDVLKVETLEDSIHKLFLTDHHWNAYGMYEAYCDINSLMGAASPPREPGELHIIEGAVFYGSNARQNGYYSYTDTFFFYDYNLPEHTITTTNPYNGFVANMQRYLEGRYDKGNSADHYVNFYPYAEYIKYPGNSTGRVLLILGDSYSRGISELVASDYDETYVFDYRRMNEIGSISAFVAEHGVTDVLFMQYSERGVFNFQNDNNLGRIRN